MVPQKPPKKPYRTRYLFNIEEAAKRYPVATPILLNKEVREIGDGSVTPADQPLTPHGG